MKLLLFVSALIAALCSSFVTADCLTDPVTMLCILDPNHGK
uniref:RH09485p n=1 Tax=Drosophila melanogaster TaxID=7227 RepID=Q8MYV7_DROME|nr:RH09485p [Drosophila melanogaster]